MKLKVVSIAAIMLASFASAAFADEACTTEIGRKIKDDITGKGYAVEDITCFVFSTGPLDHLFEVDVTKDGKKTELWVDEKLNIVNEILE